MKSLRWRDSSFNPRRGYSGVTVQQGRVETDNDWNEGTDERQRDVYGAIVDGLKPLVPDGAQDWTRQKRSDSGLPLLGLFAFLASALAGGIAVRWLLNRRSSPTFSVSVDGHPWYRVDSLEEAGPDERVYQVNTETGMVEFGDGVHGRVPEGGVTIKTSYEHGAGAAGAVGVGWIVSTAWVLWLCRRLRRRQALNRPTSRHSLHSNTTASSRTDGNGGLEKRLKRFPPIPRFRLW